jgi:hypothetical protein
MYYPIFKATLLVSFGFPYLVMQFRKSVADAKQLVHH